MSRFREESFQKYYKNILSLRNNKLKTLILASITLMSLFVTHPGNAQNSSDSKTDILDLLETGEKSIVKGIDLSLTYYHSDILDLLKMGEEDTINFLIRENTKPINKDEDTGFCFYFAKALEEKVNKDFGSESSKEIKVTINHIPEIEDPPYDSVINGDADIQCGADTRRDKYYLSTKKFLSQIIYTNSFFTSGIRILFSNEIDSNKFSQGKYADTKIGVVKNTTTEDYFIRNHITTEPCNKRTQCITKLEEGIIQGFASDNILLQGFIEPIWDLFKYELTF